MTSVSHPKPEEAGEPPRLGADDHIAPVPRVSVQAFCETERTSAAIQAASQDRRLGKAHIVIKMGGVDRAIETYHSQ
ncbi:MAG: pilus assembly protein CpaE, partial [Bradyrhizobium sp.]